MAEMLDARSPQLHDLGARPPLLYEESQEMVGRLASDLRQTSRKTTVLLLHPGPGPSPAGDGRAGWVFCFYPKA
ncbi:MAG: hypothetical protein GX463_07930 [Methanothrix sp.]|nr:hypothetical protein [Methanothrix sp.]